MSSDKTFTFPQEDFLVSENCIVEFRVFYEVLGRMQNLAMKFFYSEEDSFCSNAKGKIFLDMEIKNLISSQA